MSLDHRIRQWQADLDSDGHASTSACSSSVELDDNYAYETATSLSQTTTSEIYSVRTNNHVHGTQSYLFCDGNAMLKEYDINELLAHDLKGRIVRSTDHITGFLFPDSDFGFPINDQFLTNFRDSFLTESLGIDYSNLSTEHVTSTFLNRMVSTIAKFLRATKQTTLEPLRYFSAVTATQDVAGRIPNIALLPLVDGHTLDGPITWHDVHAMVEHTQEQKLPKWMAEAVSFKSYMTFRAQPDRDFVPFLCITGNGFHIVLSDRVGHIDTDAISLSPSSGALTFLRMVMGFAFLPDNNIGLDTTMTRRQRGRRSGTKFCDEYQPFDCKVEKASIQLLVPVSSVSGTTNFPPDTTTDSPPLATGDPATGTPPQYSGEEISSISIGSTEYPVIRLLFQSPSLIGCATRVFLVQLPDGRRGVLKDSWIRTDRHSEVDFLRGLEIPFGPQLVDACVLGDTGYFRSLTTPLIMERREKRRVVTYPAGVHISDFSSLWELMAAMLDIVIAIMYLASKQKLHRNISYTNVLLREVDDFSKDASLQARKHVMEHLGLSEIEFLRNELKSREGLLIDFNYAAALSVLESELALAAEDKRDGGNCSDEDSVNAASSNGGPSALISEAPKTSGARTGTPPFMAIEVLIHAAEHRVAHDLESLFYVLLFICTHLQGPNAQITNLPLYGNIKGQEHPSVLSGWFAMNHLSSLGHLKYSHMFFHFESHVLPYISPYFYPLRKHLTALWNALFPQRMTGPVGRPAVESPATCQNIIQVFKEALLDPALIGEAMNATRNDSILGKRSRPGEGDVARL